jgi:hypothetical protein
VFLIMNIHINIKSTGDNNNKTTKNKGRER